MGTTTCQAPKLGAALRQRTDIGGVLIGSDDARSRARGGIRRAGAFSAVVRTIWRSVDVLLIDRSEAFVFGFSKLDVMFGRAEKDVVQHHYRELTEPGVRFVSASIEAIDPATKTVTTDVGTFEGDILVVALGADVDPAATPGLIEGGHEFYTNAGAFALREVLEDFDGGRIIVGVTSTPFKCPPAPSETVLLMHELLTKRGLRGRSEISLVMPLGPPSPIAAGIAGVAGGVRRAGHHLAP